MKITIISILCFEKNIQKTKQKIKHKNFFLLRQPPAWLVRVTVPMSLSVVLGLPLLAKFLLHILQGVTYQQTSKHTNARDVLLRHVTVSEIKAQWIIMEY